eukprot:5243781-Amphidinium_carterae.1
MSQECSLTESNKKRVLIVPIGPSQNIAKREDQVNVLIATGLESLKVLCLCSEGPHSLKG